MAVTATLTTETMRERKEKIEVKRNIASLAFLTRGGTKNGNFKAKILILKIVFFTYLIQ